jgi:hypothetical protein
MICDIGDLRPGTPARISAANARAVHLRPPTLSGPCFLRYSLAYGTRPWEHLGDHSDEAIAARERKQPHFEALDANPGAAPFKLLYQKRPPQILMRLLISPPRSLLIQH